MKKRTIIDSKVAATLTKKLNNHFKSLAHQPVTIVFQESEESSDFIDIEIRSAEGTMKFEAGIHTLK